MGNEEKEQDKWRKEVEGRERVYSLVVGGMVAQLLGAHMTLQQSKAKSKAESNSLFMRGKDSSGFSQ